MTDIEIAVQAAKAGAEIIRARFGSESAVTMKGAVDPVTVADREADEAIVGLIASERPQDGFVTEERGEWGPDTERRWIIDPLDGTINFIHGIPHVGVSVALLVDGSPRVGVVVDVFRAEIFAAEVGRGTTLNGWPARVSRTSDFGKALVVTGFPYDRQQHALEYVRSVGAVLQQAMGVRRLGSAALDFAYVAAGRFEAFWEFLLAPWDVAAGMLLVREAGGKVVDHRGEEFRVGGRAVVAGVPAIVDKLVPLISENLPPHIEP